MTLRLPLTLVDLSPLVLIVVRTYESRYSVLSVGLKVRCNRAQVYQARHIVVHFVLNPS